MEKHRERLKALSVKLIQEETCISFIEVKTLLLKSMLFISTAFAFILIPVNLYIAHDYSMVLIDLFIGLFTSIAFYQIHWKKRYYVATLMGVFTLFATFLGVAYLEHGKDFSLIWSYFFAPFAIITLGAHRGLIISTVFLITIFILAFFGIHIWQDGSWNTLSFLRFVFAHIAMLYIMYTTVESNEKAFEKIELLREHEQGQLKLFEKLSITDPLTSLYNRRFLKDIFPEQFNHTIENNGYFAFFLLDIDYFKPFNDTYGHHQGDKVLKEIADLFHEHIKYGFRIGGDEFAGIVTGENEAVVREIIEDFYQAIQEIKIENKLSPLVPYITCSIGVHICTEHQLTFEDIYQLTDTALYKAKALGRNQIVYL
jgi:diguanylate cyclase (GGDEF)-like protein